MRRILSLDPEKLAEALKSTLAGDVESADIEICASGFDNLLMGPDLDELIEHQKNLQTIGSPKCAGVIGELLDWLRSDSGKEPITEITSDEGRINNIWRAYDLASCEENPRQLAADYEQGNG